MPVGFDELLFDVLALPSLFLPLAVPLLILYVPRNIVPAVFQADLFPINISLSSDPKLPHLFPPPPSRPPTPFRLSPGPGSFRVCRPIV